MCNVIRIMYEPPPEKKIRDMRPGEDGYTVPWAYDPKTKWLDTEHTIGEMGGTACLYVECIAPGEYSIEFHEPVYKNLFG